MGTLSTIPKKISRMLPLPRRRRHKVSLVSSILVLAILLFILTQHTLSLSPLADFFDFKSTSSSSSSIHDSPQPPTVNNPETHTNWLWKLSESFINSFTRKKPTLPYASVQKLDESIDPSQLVPQLDQHSDIEHLSDLDTKLRLVNDLHNKFDPGNRRLSTGYQFFNNMFEIFYRGKPKIDKLDTYLSDQRIYHARYDTNPKSDSQNNDDAVFTEEYLSQFLQLTDDELLSMTKAHTYVQRRLPDQAPDGLYSGDGIVFVGGGKFNWLTLLSIKSIRAMGSTLPIEVLIPKLDEYEPDLCARVFPALNARCIYLPHMLADLHLDDQNSELNTDNEDDESFVAKFNFKGFQYKALAILVSSFENVLLLDSDNIPVHLPDPLFSSEPFTSHGLIVWPDFWKRATSPDYYKIAGIEFSDDELLPIYNEVKGTYEVPPPDSPFYKTTATGHKIIDLKTTPLHQRVGAIPDPTSESGQLMISKRTHIKPLLLALYYNLYGPTHFYPLFSQGSDGEGDKETFLAASVALQKPFYQVSKFLNAFGYFDSDNTFQGTGMGQYDPIQDLEVARLNDELSQQKSPEQQQLMIAKNLLLQKGPRILFVHANYPKLDPWALKVSGKIFNKRGDRIRLYGTGMKVRTGHDFETAQWTNMKFLLCDLNIDINFFANVDRQELCSEINEHLDFLKSTISTLE